DAKNLAGLIFNSLPDQEEGVNLIMNKGAGADAFKGSVVTYGTDDTIKLSGKGVKVSSGDGKDSISSGNGNDSIDSGNGNDSINSGAGNDSINSGAGNDSINSGAGNDSINSGTGNDSINSGTGNDSINSGSGNDSVVIGSGKDIVKTESGIDIVKLAAGFTGTAKLDGGSQSDTLDLSLENISNVVVAKGHVVVTLDNGSVINSVNFEKFIYDSNGSEAGGIETVGVKAFDAFDFNG
ncbi:MAG: calcium-binding protein, partial [Methylococcales bacterium]|nr:calcium-binding protein [Methylococcales bacterium]